MLQNNRFTHNLKKKYITENILEIDDVRLDMFYDVKLKQFHDDFGTDFVYCIVDPSDNTTILTESILIFGSGLKKIRYEFTREPSSCGSQCPIVKQLKTIMNRNTCVPCQSNTEYYDRENETCKQLPGCSPGLEFSPFENVGENSESSSSVYGYITFDNGIPTEHTDSSSSPPTREYVLFATNESSIPTGTCVSCETNKYQPKYNSLDQCEVCQQQGNFLKYVNKVNSTCDICTSTRRNDPGTNPKIRTQDQSGEYDCTDCPRHPVDSQQRFARIYSEGNECKVECPLNRKYGLHDEKIITERGSKTITYNNDSTFNVPTCDWKCVDHMTKNGDECDACPVGTQKTERDIECVQC